MIILWGLLFIYGPLLYYSILYRSCIMIDLLSSLPLTSVLSSTSSLLQFSSCFGCSAVSFMLPSLILFRGSRIYWLHLYRAVRPPPIQHPGYDIKQSDGEAPVLEIWINAEYSFIAITPKSTLTRSGSTK